MKDFLNKLLNPDYKKFYGLYKKLPGILAIIIAALFFIWSIVDLSVFSDDGGFYGGYFHSPSYGIMELESPILVLLIWWISGAITTVCTWFFSVLVVSVTVTRTDATLAIENAVYAIKNNTNNEPHKPIAPSTNSQVEIQIVPSPSQVAEQPKTVAKPIATTVKKQPIPSIKRCPHCGDIVKSKTCEMCGKTNNLFD